MEEKIEIFESNNNQSQPDFYKKFKERLDEGQTFPANYIYKFILPADHYKMAMLHAIFENAKASFSTRESSSGKYTSFTIMIVAKSADEIIEYYKEVATIKGVVML